MKTDFTENERQVVEESFQQYMQVLTIIARLHGLNARGALQLAEDRSGFIIPDPPSPKEG